MLCLPFLLLKKRRAVLIVSLKTLINVSKSFPECVVHTCPVLSAGRWQEVLELKLQQTSNEKLHGKRCENKGGAGVLLACVGLFGDHHSPHLDLSAKDLSSQGGGKEVPSSRNSTNKGLRLS